MSQDSSTAGTTEEGANVVARMAIKIVVLIALMASLVFVSASFRKYVDLEAFLAFIKSTGPLAPLVYMGIYLIGPTIFLPASILTMASGVIFGPVMGTIYTIFSATMGATVPFLITRKFGRKPLEKTLGRYENFDRKFQEFEKSVETQGWKYVAFTRLVTFFPFLILNYAFGLTRIRLWTYVWASFVFMLPGSFMFNYMGYAGREALAGSEGMITKISILVGCIILMTALPGLAKKLQKTSQDKKEAQASSPEDA